MLLSYSLNCGTGFLSAKSRPSLPIRYEWKLSIFLSQYFGDVRSVIQENLVVRVRLPYLICKTSACQLNARLNLIHIPESNGILFENELR